MRNFDFYSPTYFVFGKDREAETGRYVKRFGGSRVLVVYGGQSAKRSGLLDRIMACLKEENLYAVELGGVKPNPRSGLVYEGIDLCRREKIDFILAVGGGSAMGTVTVSDPGVRLLLADGLTADNVSVSLELPERYILGVDPEAYAVYTIQGGDVQESTSVRVKANIEGLEEVVAANANVQLPASRNIKKTAGGLLAISLGATVLAAVVDCALWLLVPGRGEALPYTAAAGLALCFAQWGISRESRGSYDSFRLASLDDHPPYLVTETPRGACKQRGDLRGFYTTAMRDDYASRLQTVFLPVIFMAALVFAGLTSLGRGHGIDFLRNWSVILTAGATCSLPLCWSLPWSRLTRRQQKSGCAVAGWDGAARVGKRRGMILTDTDLFPPGTIRLNGVKVYGEELSKAAAYAAAAAHGAGCGLARVFDGLAVGENAPRETAQDLSFYEQGGFGCTIHGESVLLGTASFMRKQDVRLPGNINLKTGVFLAIDHQLAAVFAVKYEAAENVDYALRTMRRSRITPILAVRDPNITPALLKRKFFKRIKVEYPDLTDRVALSEAEEDRGLPRALLLREGLLPYAEAVVGSRRLRTAVRRATWLSLAGSAAGVLLTAYLVSLGKFDLLTPLSLTVFLLLWTLPVLLMSDWTGRY